MPLAAFGHGRVGGFEDNFGKPGRLQNLIARSALDLAAVLVAHLVRQFERSRLHDDPHRGLLRRFCREPRFTRKLADGECWVVAHGGKQTRSEGTSGEACSRRDPACRLVAVGGGIGRSHIAFNFKYRWKSGAAACKRFPIPTPPKSLRTAGVVKISPAPKMTSAAPLSNISVSRVSSELIHSLFDRSVAFRAS